MNKHYLYFENYKLFAEKEVEINPDANIVLVTGDNESGKSTIINAVKEAYSLCRITPIPLMDGENEGSFRIDITDKNGESLTIVYEFWANSSGKFYAIKNGKKITTIKDIRDIIGSCTIYTVPELSLKMRNSDERKKVIEEIIKPIAGETNINELLYLDAKIKSVFDERRDIGRDLKSLENTLDKFKVSEEELKKLSESSTLLKERETYEAKFAELKSMFDEYEETKKELFNAETLYNQEVASYESLISLKKSQVVSIDNELEELEKRKASLLEERNRLTEEINTKPVYKNEITINTIISRFSELQKKVESQETIYTFFKEQLDSIDNKLTEIEPIRIKQSSITPIKEEYDRVNGKYVEKDNELKELREKQKKIIETLNLPAGLSIADNSIEIDDLPFDDSQISESSMYLALVELLCRINTSRFIAAGSYSMYNKERLGKLIDIAKKYNKQIWLEHVVEGQVEADVKCIINNDDPNILGNKVLDMD